MEIELSVNKKQFQAKTAQKLRGYFSDFNILKNKSLKMEETYLDQKNKQYLLQKPGNEQKIQDNYIKLESQSQQLNGIKSATQEITYHMNNIQYDLQDQRQVILNIKNENKDLQKDLANSNRLQTLLSNRRLFNKIILLTVAFILALINLFLLFHKLRKLFI